MALRRFGSTDEDYLKNRTLVANAIVGLMMPDGAVKGGSAMKIRFGDKGTRASTDLDVARSSDLDTFMGQFEERLADGWHGFEGRIVPRDPAHPEGIPTSYVMRPYDVKLSYLGSSWCTVPLEVGHNEIGDADEPDLLPPIDANAVLESMGFPAIGAIPTMAIDHQIAQKLHGASEPGSRRAHDLIDLQLIFLRSNVDLAKARRTCERLFAYRKRQAWPPKVLINEGWEDLYLAQLLPPPIKQTVGEAVVWANDLIAVIACS